MFILWIITITIIGLGIYVSLDGLISFLYYYVNANQRWVEHLARFVRIGVGLTLILIGYFWLLIL